MFVSPRDWMRDDWWAADAGVVALNDGREVVCIYQHLTGCVSYLRVPTTGLNLLWSSSCRLCSRNSLSSWMAGNLYHVTPTTPRKETQLVWG